MKKKYIINITIVFLILTNINCFSQSKNKKSDILIDKNTNSEMETMDKYINSNEFNIVVNSIKNVKFYDIVGIWALNINDINKKESSSQNEYKWSDESCSNVLFRHHKYLIFSYHLNGGSNTGTLIYDRKSGLYKTYPFNSDKLENDNLLITREGYNNGHWWQSGTLNLNTKIIKWSKNIER
jgi:hypothetical protein